MRREIVLACLTASMLGCGGGTKAVIEETVPVTGIATYQGKPLEDYMVYFSNLSNRTASGIIDAEGRFTLGTNGPGDGAPAGIHKVWFVYSPAVESNAGSEMPDAPQPQPKVKLPAKFSRLEMSGLTVEVPEEGLTDYKLEVK